MLLVQSLAFSWVPLATFAFGTHSAFANGTDITWATRCAGWCPAASQLSIHRNSESFALRATHSLDKVRPSIKTRCGNAIRIRIAAIAIGQRPTATRTVHADAACAHIDDAKTRRFHPGATLAIHVTLMT